MSAALPLSTCSSNEWKLLRESLLGTLCRDYRRGRLDADIVDILFSINSCSVFATSSSCSGRIAVIAAPRPHDKRRGGLVATWHRRVKTEELAEAVTEALRRGADWYVWVSAQPVILALHTCRLDAANDASRLLNSLGFKYAGFRFRERSRSYYIVVQGSERLDVPLAVRGRRLRTLEQLDVITDVLNDYLSLAKNRLEELKRAAALLRARFCSGDEEATLCT
jgi:tRNA wybutosine-synthesizing protein 3